MKRFFLILPILSSSCAPSFRADYERCLREKERLALLCDVIFEECDGYTRMEE
jgi:hypothetical protein